MKGIGPELGRKIRASPQSID
jgi:hypothetical protein